MWKAECAPERMDKDPDIFFPERESGEMTYHRQEVVAKSICMRCEVRIECLNYAMVNTIREGVWGGLSASERGRLRKTRTPA